MEKFFIIILLFFLQIYSYAQSERELINDGVELYKEGKFADSEVNFKKGISKNPESAVANFNLGDAYYKQNRFDEAIKSYQSVLTQTDDKNFKARTYHNIGNSFLKSQKYKESVESYKNALKLNPHDEETKYNLSYALSMMKKEEQQQNQNQNQDKKEDQDKNENKNDQQKNDQNKKDDNEQKNNQNQQEQKPDQNQTAQQDNLKQKEEENKISKAEAERILEALKNNEKDLQKKLRKKTGVPVKTDKDW